MYFSGGPDIGKFGIELGVFGGAKHDGKSFEALRLNLKGNEGLKCKNTQPTEKKKHLLKTSPTSFGTQLYRCDMYFFIYRPIKIS